MRMFLLIFKDCILTWYHVINCGTHSANEIESLPYLRCIGSARMHRDCRRGTMKKSEGEIGVYSLSLREWLLEQEIESSGLH